MLGIVQEEQIAPDGRLEAIERGDEAGEGSFLAPEVEPAGELERVAGGVGGRCERYRRERPAEGGPVREKQSGAGGRDGS